MVHLQEVWEQISTMSTLSTTMNAFLYLRRCQWPTKSFAMWGTILHTGERGGSEGNIIVSVVHAATVVFYCNNKQIEFGRLLSCFKSESGHSYCIVNKFEELMTGENAIGNEMDCPLTMGSGRYEVIVSANVAGAISLVHECGSSCLERIGQLQRTVERENVTTTTTRSIKHDKTNKFYCLNLYCINLYSVLSH